MKKTFLEYFQNVKLKVPGSAINIARNIMPQISSDKVAAFTTFAKIEGVSCEKKLIAASELKPSQGEFNLEKVRQLMDTDLQSINIPVIVSSDYYLMDGHHRWLAALNKDENFKLQAYVFDAEVNDLLALMRRFPKSFYKTIDESKKANGKNTI